MTNSDDTGFAQPLSVAQVGRRCGQLSRYDLVLAVIPLVFGLALVSHRVLSLSLSAAMAAGSVIAVLAVVDALFLNPPALSRSDAG